MKILFYESENDESVYDEVQSNIIPEIGSCIYVDGIACVKSVYINYKEDECMVYFIRLEKPEGQEIQ